MKYLLRPCPNHDTPAASKRVADQHDQSIFAIEPRDQRDLDAGEFPLVIPNGFE